MKANLVCEQEGEAKPKVLSAETSPTLEVIARWHIQTTMWVDDGFVVPIKGGVNAGQLLQA